MSNGSDRIGSRNLADRIEVRNPRDELERLATTFANLPRRLRISFERQKQSMADASHEPRAPILIARTAAQVRLQREDRPVEEYREALAMVGNQMARLTRVVIDPFLLARADSGASQLRKRQFALNQTVFDPVKATQVLASGKYMPVSS